MARVSIYHNVARDDRGRAINFLGYHPGHPVVPVFVYDSEEGGEDPAAIAEEAFVLFNCDVDQLTGPRHDLAAVYRRRGLRSLSVGDVILVGDGQGGRRIALGVAPIGFHDIDAASLVVADVCEHGTRPWSSRPASEPE